MPIFGVFTHREIECFKRAILYMELHFRDKCSPDQLAEEVGINIKLLRAGIHLITGSTIHDHLVKIRIKSSLVELQDFNKSIKLIAHKCGFSSSSHFSMEFKKQLGETPTAYRYKLLVSANAPYSK